MGKIYFSTELRFQGTAYVRLDALVMVLLQKTTFIFNLPSLQRGRFLYWRDTYNILNRQCFRELHCSVNVVKLRVDESAQRGDSLAVAEELEGTVLENVKVSFN